MVEFVFEFFNIMVVIGLVYDVLAVRFVFIKLFFVFGLVKVNDMFFFINIVVWNIIGLYFIVCFYGVLVFFNRLAIFLLFIIFLFVGISYSVIIMWMIVFLVVFVGVFIGVVVNVLFVLVVILELFCIYSFVVVNVDVLAVFVGVGNVFYWILVDVVIIVFGLYIFIGFGMFLEDIFFKLVYLFFVCI